MGKVKPMAVVLVATLLLGGCYLVARISASAMQGYTWDEMDWGRRGRTSITDFLAASDIGKREIEKDGKKCIEYFSYKDGLPVKVACSE